MSSSTFRRRTRDAQTDSKSNGKPGAPLLCGTKPWTGGVTLTSSGLRDLDAILGGGQPLGTCLLLEDDRWTPDVALCLTRYWCAEAVSNDQTMMIITSGNGSHEYSLESPALASDTASDEHDYVFQGPCSPSQAREFLNTLPRDLHKDKQMESLSHTMDQSTESLQVLDEEDEALDGGVEEGLQIAWQYRKSIQRDRLGHRSTIVKDAGRSVSPNVYCHSYDLSGRMKDQRSQEWLDEENGQVHLVDGSCETQPCQLRQCAFSTYQKLMKKIKQLCGDGQQVVRILWHFAPISPTSLVLSLLLSQIRAHRLPVVILVTIQSWTCSSRASLSSLRRGVDVIIQSQGFVSRGRFPPPPEFRDFVGLLLIPKVSVVTAATGHGGGHFADVTSNKRPSAHVYGVKRDRRKLHISLLHIPPEQYAGGGSSVRDGVRSGAGRSLEGKASAGCSAAGSSVLDF